MTITSRLYMGQWVSDDCRGESLSRYPPPPDSQVRVHGTNARLTSRGRVPVVGRSVGSGVQCGLIYTNTFSPSDRRVWVRRAYM